MRAQDGDDGGSCIDGRLTSCWNWCSKVEKKGYFNLFLLTGFVGFDGSFDWPGMNVNVAGDPTHTALVEELHGKVLGYIRLS